MYKSILQFIEKDTKEIEKCVENLLQGKKDATDLSEKINEAREIWQPSWSAKSTIPLMKRFETVSFAKRSGESRSEMNQKNCWTL